MRDDYLDGGYDTGRRALNRDVLHVVARIRAYFHATGKAHQRLFWSAPWKRRPAG